jgi:hypothetical protein
MFGLSNVGLQDPLVIDTAVKWHSRGVAFAHAIHSVKSRDSESFLRFDKKLVISASKIATIPVKEPCCMLYVKRIFNDRKGFFSPYLKFSPPSLGTGGVRPA